MNYQRMLKNSRYKSKSKLAKFLGVTRIRIVQITNLLKLSEPVKERLLSLGESWERPLITERRLRDILKIKEPYLQLEALERVLSKRKEAKK
jgi:hypothetical protein